MWKTIGNQAFACALLIATCSGCGGTPEQSPAEIRKEQARQLETMKSKLDAKAKTIAEDNRLIGEDQALGAAEKQQAISVNQDELIAAQKEYEAAKARFEKP